MSSVLAQALLHSLWQIGVLAVALWILLRLIPTRMSDLRYSLSLTCLYATPLMFILTSFALSGSGAPQAISLTHPAPDAHFASLIVWIWGLGALVPGFKLLRSGNELHRLLRRPMQPAPRMIDDRFCLLLERIGLSRRVTLLVSEYVTSACTAAYWKPVILLPPAYLTRLSVEEVEAIMAHELAHIKRHDGLHRLVQVLIDIAFYFHPCLLWISQQVSIEREHACDDLASTFIADRQNLASGLLKAKLAQAENALLLAAQSRSYQALDARIRRLVPVAPTSSPQIRRAITPYAVALALIVAGAGTALSPLWTATANALPPDFSRATLVSLKNDVCDHIGARELYWTPPFNKPGHATIHVANGTVFMNDNELPARDQVALKTVFKTYNLASFPEVRLRYFGDDVKLIVTKNGGENSAPYVYLAKSGSDRVDTFRMPKRQPS